MENNTNKNENSQIAFFPCPKCQGFGYTRSMAGVLTVCDSCKDRPSLYSFFNNKVLYYDRRIDTLTIAENRYQSLIRKIINYSLIVFGVLGILALLYSFWEILLENRNPFWLLNERTFLLFIFWASLAGDFYFFYRYNKYRDSLKKIKYSREFSVKPLPENIKQTFSFDAAAKYDKKKKRNIAKYLTEDSFTALEKAYQNCHKYKNHEVKPIHLFIALLEYPSTQNVLLRLNLSLDKLIKKLPAVLAKEPTEGSGTEMGLDIMKVVHYAYTKTVQQKKPQITNAELLYGIIEVDESIRNMFFDLEVDKSELEEAINLIFIRTMLRDKYREWRGKAGFKPKGMMNRAMTARPTPLLNSIGQDFTLKARAGHFFPVIGRDNEIQEIFRILKESKGNPMLVGDAGVGKSTLLEGLAQLMASEDVPTKWQDKRLVVVDPGSLIAGAAGTGSLEARMQQIIVEIVKAGNVLLAIEDIHNLLSAGSTGSAIDIGSILMNYLSQGYLQVVGTTTTKEFQEFIQDKETFLRRFQIVKFDEMSRENSLHVLEAKSALIENKHKVFFTIDSLRECVNLTDRYIKDRHLPAKALDLMEEVGIHASEKKGANALVTEDEVHTVFSDKSDVPVAKVSEEEAQKLLNLEQIMHQRVVGQDEAINAVAAALRRARQELREEDKPIANFLFLGPTGVGKTETAKTIAEVMFGDERKMIRLDMSEYQSPDSVNKMIGFAGSKGTLTEAVRNNPFSIILLDELEKADKNVLNIFLQVMDDGRLTDGTGRTVEFNNAIIVATSNAGAYKIQDYLKENIPLEQIRQRLLDEDLKEAFRPEFLNRFDRVVVFKPLTLEEVTQIAGLMINKLAATLAKKGINLEATPEAIAELAQAGYDPKYGARPLKRVIQDTVEDALSKFMLSGQIGRRDTAVLLPGGQIKIRKAQGL